jgi:hypothetical protein
MLLDDREERLNTSRKLALLILIGVEIPIECSVLRTSPLGRPGLDIDLKQPPGTGSSGLRELRESKRRNEMMATGDGARQGLSPCRNRSQLGSQRTLLKLGLIFRSLRHLAHDLVECGCTTRV